MLCSVIIPVPAKAMLTRQRLARCCAGFLERIDIEIIVVDDGAAGTGYQPLANGGNRIRAVMRATGSGPISARNDGAAAASGKYLIFLNQDMVPQRGWLDALVNYAENHPCVAAVGSKLLSANGTTQHAGVVIDQTGMPRPLYAGFPADHPAVNKSRRFQAVSGTGMLIRRALFGQLGGFDPTLPSGCEDVDLCLRLAERGWEVHYCHESVLHRIGSISQATPPQQPERNAETFRSRWAHRVRPDDLGYFVADGLIQVEYRPLYPICLSVAPELARAGRDDRDPQAYRLLEARTRKVLELIKENARLNGRIREVEWQAAASSLNDAGLLAPASEPDLPQRALPLQELQPGPDSGAECTAASTSPPRAPEPGPGALELLGKSKLLSFLASRRTLTFPKVEQPAVTIVIPMFNKASYAYLALESLLGSEPDLAFELVLVDNASTDETPALLKQLENIRTRENERNLGFGAACNLGASLARGDYVCFLNSDTLVTPGWLTALLQTIKNYPRCGAVGSKLVHPDGKLQEAGSIIWQGGTTSGYGRGADPLQPEYCYVREVDYCSAACLLVRKDLFTSVGGFDDRYAPAYYEDADVCLSIRQAGYKVVYQPNAVVFHVEFGSSDGGQGIALQLRNRDRFIAKWASLLRGQSSPLPGHDLVARERRPGRRILVIDDLVPVAGHGMGLPRAREMLNALGSLGYVVTFLTYIGESDSSVPPAAAWLGVAGLQQSGIEVFHNLRDKSGKLAERPHLYDAMIVSRPNKNDIMEFVKRLYPDIPFIYDAEAIFAMRTIRQAEAEGKPLPAQEADSLVRAELKLTDLADVVVTVSDAERRDFQSYNPCLPVIVWGHSIAARQVRSSFSERQDLLLVGNLKMEPNADAVMHFLRNIFPVLRTRLGCRLLLVGPGPTAEVVAAASALPGEVVLTGFVDELAPFYDGCRIFIAPHRFSGGIPLKVIEAMANGVPCVISQLTADQLGVSNDVEALVAIDAQDFADKVVRLYQDQELWQRLQQAGQHLVRTRYGPAAMQAALGQCIEEAIARKKANRTAPRRDSESIRVEPETEAAAGLRS
jgi:GT2 family glycosyltransferase/glycosyltransferase involved in cell wall biosynthesis